MYKERQIEFKWDPYFMKRSVEFHEFWAEYLGSKSRNVLYVLGRGFDPRACSGLNAVLNAGGAGVRDCLLIDLDEGPDSPSKKFEEYVTKNATTIINLLNKRGNILNKTVNMWANDHSHRRRVSSRSSAAIFQSLSDFDKYTDVIIDISALPRAVYFSLIGKVLFLFDIAKTTLRKKIPNLHVIVTEHANLDRCIQEKGVDDTAAFVHGFGSNLEMEATALIPKVWIPILGEQQRGQLDRIYTLVTPNEICPVLPSPSQNPRRADEILIEYRELFFDQWRIEPRNIIYAAEQNPFEAYRQIHKAIRHYNRALQPSGGCKAIISAVSSKLLSIGALLATYELKGAGLNIGIANVESQGYDMCLPASWDEIRQEGELFTLWLFGDCYEQ